MRWTDENGQVHFGDRPPDASNVDDENVMEIRPSSNFATPKEEPDSREKWHSGMDPNDPDYNNPVNQLRRANERKRQDNIKAYQKEFTNRPENYRTNSPGSRKLENTYLQEQIAKDKAWAKENGYISIHDKDWKQQVIDKCMSNKGSRSSCSSESYTSAHKPVTRSQREAIDAKNAERRRIEAEKRRSTTGPNCAAWNRC